MSVSSTILFKNQKLGVGLISCSMIYNGEDPRLEKTLKGKWTTEGNEHDVNEVNEDVQKPTPMEKKRPFQSYYWISGFSIIIDMFWVKCSVLFYFMNYW